MGTTMYVTCTHHQITTLEQHRPWHTGPAWSLLPAARLSPQALPVLTPDMVLGPSVQGLLGDKMHHLEARYLPPAASPREISQTPAGAAGSLQCRPECASVGAVFPQSVCALLVPQTGVFACQS